MKKLVSSLLAAVLFLLLVPNVGFAAENVPLYMNGKPLAGPVPARIIGDTCVVPLRIFAESFGAKVGWSEADQRISVEQGTVRVQLQLKSATAYLNGKPQNLTVAPFTEGEWSLVPLRFIAEALGVTVMWDELTRSVFLSRQSGPVTDPVVDKPAPKPSSSPSPSAKPTPSATPSPKPSSSPSAKPSATPSAKPTVKPTPSPDSSANLPAINGISLSGDRIVIQASGKVEPNFITLQNPDRLVIDIPDSQVGKALIAPDGKKSGELALTSDMVTGVRYALFSKEPSIVRVVVDLNKKVEYTKEGSDPSQIILALKPVIKKYKVVIDAGHGDHDSGAVSLNDRYEKTFNLTMALKVYALLKNEPAISPLLTRDDDTFIPLDDRVAFANNNGADAFVSIHGNKYTSAIRGVETYYWRDNSLSLANILHGKIVAATGFPDRKVRQNDFRVIKNTTMPAVLLEIGYLSNATDEAEMYKDEFQNRVASAIVSGIKQFLKIQ